MFFYLSKTLYFFLMPLGWLTISLVLFIFLKKRKWKRRSGILFIVLLILFTSPILSNEAMRVWEYAPVPMNEITKEYDLAIVLTGVSNNARQPDDRVYFNKGADRVVHTVQLYKEGKVKTILIAGGSGSFITPDRSEAENLKRAFLLMGVENEDILLETNSKNTYQTAQNIKSGTDLTSYSEILLVTSAFHMRRAKGCFDKAEIETTPFPADFYYSSPKFTPDAWIPNHTALSKWSIVFHEIIGITAYKLMGYL